VNDDGSRYAPAVRRRWVAIVLGVLVLAGPSAARASEPYALILSSSGKVLATGTGAGFDYPADGSLVHVGRAEADRSGVTLTDVALYGNLVQATQLSIPRGRSAPLTGTIAAAGRLVPAAPNALVPFGDGSYLVFDQRAVTHGRLGRVGLRLVLGHAAFGVPGGTQVLLGVPAAPSGVAHASGELEGRFDPLAALGFAARDARLIGFSPPPSTTAGSIGSRAVAIAERFLGVPYVWGGADPLVGFDCSGLVMYVYGRLGVSLTHYTGAQFREGLPLPRAELQPGDLVFFDDDPVRGPQHEGIYIGDDRFIQAPHTGDVVKISSLAEPRYGFSYVGAVRPYVAP
jgi:cell wall-associated NlpC family hydrolase